MININCNYRCAKITQNKTINEELSTQSLEFYIHIYLNKSFFSYDTFNLYEW